MAWALRSLATGLLVASLLGVGVVPCLCSEAEDASSVGHCSTPSMGIAAAKDDCECPCMTSAELPPATESLSVLTPAGGPLAAQVAPMFAPGTLLSTAGDIRASPHPPPRPSRPPTILRV